MIFSFPLGVRRRIQGRNPYHSKAFSTKGYEIHQRNKITDLIVLKLDKDAEVCGGA